MKSILFLILFIGVLERQYISISANEVLEDSTTTEIVLPLFPEPRDETTTNENGVPHYPEPRYDEEGEIEWFPRIIGGTPAILGEFPGKISLQNRRGSHFCGGTLIDLSHVVTAAHCLVDDRARVIDPTSVQAMAGDVLITAANPGAFRTIRIGSHIFIHPQYSATTLQNDIAVLRVNGPFALQTGVTEPQPLNPGIPPYGVTCQLAGWGSTTEGGSASPRLIRVDLEILDTRQCNSSYGGLILNHMLCAGTMSGGRDACQGDSGGGLMCFGQITGIVSFGYGCGRPGFPGVYATVSSYINWINSAVNFQGPHQSIPTPTTVRPGGSSRATTSISLIIFIMFILKIMIV